MERESRARPHLRATRAIGAVVALTVAFVLFSAGAASAASGPNAAKRIDRIVAQASEKYELPSTIYGVWKKGRPITTGAIGEAQRGVPATLADHFKIGNIGESMTVTLLLQYVDEGLVSLDDPISTWFPNMCLPATCNPEEVTVGMLARSTSGFVHYAAAADFAEALYANPFRRWKMSEVMSYGLDRPPVFAPGTSWGFSDTNFLMLGRILQKIGGKPVPKLLRKKIFDPLGLDETSMRGDSVTPAPVMHAFSNERGVYEDVTGWSLNWIRGAGNVISTLGDLGKWAQALGTGSLISPQLHELQVGDENVGLGTNTEDFHYAMGSGVSNGWIYNNPHIMGYKGVLSYLPAKDVAIVIETTGGPDGDANTRYDAPIFNRIAKVVAPGEAPPRPCLHAPCPTG